MADGGEGGKKKGERRTYIFCTVFTSRTRARSARSCRRGRQSSRPRTDDYYIRFYHYPEVTFLPGQSPRRINLQLPVVAAAAAVWTGRKDTRAYMYSYVQIAVDNEGCGGDCGVNACVFTADERFAFPLLL